MVTHWIFLLGLSLVQADYLFELDLQGYSNPGGKTFGDVCCETQATNPSTGECLTVDTCDPRFSIRLQNFNTQSFLGQDYILGTFSNADSISFGSCQLIDSTMAGVQNPLNFTFTTSQFTPMDTFRVTMDISHIEGRQNNIIVTNFIQQLNSIPGTNPSFSENLTFYATAPSTLTVQFRYRLICTAGFCGNDCSQTTGCSGFPQACVPDCNQTRPCLNGGTCESGRCLCTSNYEGAQCGSPTPTVPPTVPSTTTATTLSMPLTSTQPEATSPISTTTPPSPAATLTSSTEKLQDQSDPVTGTSGCAFLGSSVITNILLSFLWCLLLLTQQ